MGCCIVVGAGENNTPLRQKEAGDLVIAADGGLDFLRLSGMEPDVVVGDFDSLREEPRHAHIIKLPVEKDDTDLAFALKYGLERGHREFHIYGGTGGRADHTLANLQCLLYLANQNARGFLHGGGHSYTCIKNGSIEFDESHTGAVSVFAWGGMAEGVTLTGLYYPLTNATLAPDFPLGVSNAFTGKKSKVEVASGALLVVWENGK